MDLSTRKLFPVEALVIFELTRREVRVSSRELGELFTEKVFKISWAPALTVENVATHFKQV